MEWIGTKIEQRVQETNFSLTKLADVVGVSRQTIHDWINGQIPKGLHLINLCEALQISPNYFFTDTTQTAIVVPVHRTRRNAKITPMMQKEAIELAKGYDLFFQKSQESDIIPVARIYERTQENIIKISEELRVTSGIEHDVPIDYIHTFKLLAQLGINIIFRDFPENIKSYAFFTKIHHHRVVFVNNSTNILDLIFPLLHEAIHAIRDEINSNTEYDQVEEDFCDDVANHIQFPNSYVNFVYETIYDLPPGIQVNKLKAFGEKYHHALYGVILRIKSLFPSFSDGSSLSEQDICKADTNLKKNFPTIGDILFSKQDPRDYLINLTQLSPNFLNKLLKQSEEISYRKLSELLGFESVLDAKAVKQELASLPK